MEVESRQQNALRDAPQRRLEMSGNHLKFLTQKSNKIKKSHKNFFFFFLKKKDVWIRLLLRNKDVTIPGS